MRLRLLLRPAAFLAGFFPFFLGKEQKLRPASFLVRIRSSHPEGFRLPVIDAPQFPAHDFAEDLIDRIKYLSPASEILVKIDPHAGFPVLIVMVFLQEQPRFRLSETIDTLLHISHHETVIPPLPAAGDAFEDRLLDQVAVLVFIHHDLREIFGKHIRCPAGNQLPLLFPGQDFQGKMLLVAEIQDIFPPLLFSQPFRKLKRQICQAAGILRRLPHLMEHRLRRELEILVFQGFQNIFHVIADLHDPAADPFIRVCHGLASAAGEPLELQVRQELSERLHGPAPEHFFQKSGVRPQYFYIRERPVRRPGHLFRQKDLVPAVRNRPLQFFHDLFRSAEILPGSVLWKFIQRRAVFQPFFRLRMSLGIFIELQDQLLQPASPVPAAVAFGKPQEIRILRRARFLYYLLRRILF